MSEIQKTHAAIEAARGKKFEFGFRYPLLNGKAELRRGQRGFSWTVRSQIPKLEDPTWYGPCLFDSHLTLALLESQVGQGANATIQYLTYEVSSGDQGDHGIVLVEHQGGDEPAIMEEIDHTRYYRTSLHSMNRNVISWKDLTKEEVDSMRLRPGATYSFPIDYAPTPYTEFEIGGQSGMSSFSVEDIMHPQLGPLLMIELYVATTDSQEFGNSLGLEVICPSGAFADRLYKPQLDRDIAELSEYDNKNWTRGNEVVAPALRGPLKQWMREILRVIHPAEVLKPLLRP